ncbi:T9SS-dependent choice-of-anchor J family protein [Gaetbulibacter jejuensis]|uniref:T9SS-dependent choice-of-anchor J family protein n=1 Tax=Gaetbulibacter jejuensis TaxID=584607 RepID=UPI003008F314
MKKITLMIALAIFSFCWQSNAQISEDFEVDPPSGWTFMQTEGDDPGFVQTSSRANSGTYSFYHNDDNIATESTSWMISPSYTVSTGDVLEFYYNHNYTSIGYGVEEGIWISTTSADPINNPGDFTLLYDLLANASEDVWTLYSQSLDAYAGQTVYFAFKYVGDWEDELYIDDFFAGAPPTCLEPSAMTANNITSTSADLSWTLGDAESMWNLEWKAGADFNPGAGEEDGSDSVSGSPEYNSQLTGLTANTEYYVYYQADCGGETSDWVAFTFTTPAAPPANDECLGAIELTVEGEIADLPSATQIPGTIAGATDSGIAAPTGTANDDVWYSFTATATDINIDVTDDFDGVIQLFSGDCNNLTSIEYDDYDSTYGNPRISRTDFVVGQTYYVRVYYYYSGTPTSSDFTIALWSTSEVLSVGDVEENSQFTYFPNPVNDKLTLNAQSNIQNVAVYNMLGQEVINASPNTLDAEVDMVNLNSGAYFVKVTIDNATKTIRVIKN